LLLLLLLLLLLFVRLFLIPSAHLSHHYEKDDLSTSGRFGFRLVGYVYYRTESDEEARTIHSRADANYAGEDENGVERGRGIDTDVLVHMTSQDLLMNVREKTELMFHLKRYASLSFFIFIC
jgi:hypothetical protein